MLTIDTLSLLGITIPALITAVWTVFTFMDESRKYREQRQRALDQSERELVWQRTKFLLELAEKFDRDITIQECVRAMVYPQYELGTDTPVLKRILRAAPMPCPSNFFTLEEIETREKFDRALSFLDDLYYCVQRKVLTSSEVSHYGYFLYQIYQSEPVKSYCELNGFHNVLSLCELVRKESEEKAV